MIKKSIWKQTSALIGLGSLAAYIIACTSFSPDDSKVLYSTVDGKTGITGIAVYDRKTEKSELLFQPYTQDLNKLVAKPSVIRPQWLEGGHSFLASWFVANEEKDANLNLAVLPFDKRGTMRTFQMLALDKEAATQFYFWPLPVVENTVFLVDNSKSIVKLKLETGEMLKTTNSQELILFASQDNKRLMYLKVSKGDDIASELGIMEPETLVRTPVFKNMDSSASLLSFAISRDAGKFAYQVDDESPKVVHLLESDKPARILPLPSLDTNLEMNIRQFSPKGDIIYASFKQTLKGNTNAAYGILEIPLDGSAIRKTTLIESTSAGDKDLLATLQVDLSHDGKTIAIESLWLAYDDQPLKPEDCALFLVDVSHPDRKVTKIAIPLPPKGQPAPFGK